MAAAPEPEPEGLEPEAAAAAFDRFAALSGRWQGSSTKGWTNEVVIDVIARGSVVRMSSFDSHPGEAMVTMVHRDGDDLVLTHYCVAGNQPRLKATEVADDGRTVTFTFRDGTNLASRDQGHMDSVVYRFEEDGSYRSRWTWYQDGSSRWMEDIGHVRVTEPR